MVNDDDLPRIGPRGRVPSAGEIQAAMALLREAGIEVLARREFGFMRVWIERDAEITDAVRERTGRWAFYLHLLRRTLATLPLDGQRMAVTQAEFALVEGLRAAEVSLAFKVLAEVGALLLPRRAGKSLTWEVDATFATRLNDAKRDEAIERQRREVAEAHAAVARRAPVKLRDLGPIVESATVADERQPLLV